MKKMLSITLSLSLLLTLLMPAFATEQIQDDAEVCSEVSPVFVDGFDITVDAEEEIQRALLGITDLETDSSMVMVSPVERLSEDDASVQTYVTTRAIQLPTNNITPYSEVDSNEPTIYATTGVAVYSSEKTTSDSENKDYVTAYATIYWRDNLGMFNDFLGASGGWDTDTDPSTQRKPRLSDKKLNLEAYFDRGHRENRDFPVVGNTWDVSQEQFPYCAWVFFVTMEVTINGSASPFVFEMLTSMLS